MWNENREKRKRKMLIGRGKDANEWWRMRRVVYQRKRRRIVSRKREKGRGM